MSSSLHQKEDFKAALKIDFIPIDNIYYNQTSTTVITKHPIKPDMTGGQKMFREERGTSNLLTKYKLQPLQNIFKDRSRIVICYVQTSIELYWLNIKIY